MYALTGQLFTIYSLSFIALRHNRMLRMVTHIIYILHQNIHQNSIVFY